MVLFIFLKPWARTGQMNIETIQKFLEFFHVCLTISWGGLGKGKWPKKLLLSWILRFSDQLYCAEHQDDHVV
jgi:hypothetical protein